MAFSKFRLFYYLDSFIVIILLHVILSVTDTYPNILTWIYLTYTIFLMKRIYDKDVDHEKSYLTMSQSKFRSIYFIDLGVNACICMVRSSASFTKIIWYLASSI